MVNLYVIDACHDWETLVVTVVANNEKEALELAINHCKKANDDAQYITDPKIVETYELVKNEVIGVKNYWVHNG